MKFSYNCQSRAKFLLASFLSLFFILFLIVYSIFFFQGIVHVHCMWKIGPLQLAIHVVQNCRAGEQNLHWDKTNKRHIILNFYFLCLSGPSVTFALEQSSCVPREWLAAKGPLHILSLFY